MAVALTAWAANDAKTELVELLACAALTAAALLNAVWGLTLRVEVDDQALRRRSLWGRQTLRWDEIRVALLVDTAYEGVSVVHRRTRDPQRAFHILLVPKRAKSRRWGFNRWMTGFEALARELTARELIALVDPEAPPPGPLDEALKRGEKRYEQFIRGAMTLISGFALVFSLLVAAVSLVSALNLSLTGGLLDFVIVAAVLLGAVHLLSLALVTVGAGHFAAAAPGLSARANWMLSAAGVVLGLVFLSWFIPRALAGQGEAPWVDWILVGRGLLCVCSGLTSWLRGR